MTILRFTGGKVLAADTVWTGCEILVDGSRIVSVTPVDGDGGIDLAGGWLMPGFIDTQVNGGGGVLLNNDLSVAAVATIADAHAAYGTTALLPTLISETPDLVAAAMDVTDAAIRAGVPGVVGVHIEGPVLNPLRKGIHDADRFRRLDDEMLAILTRPHAGKVMVTLAPERTDPAAIATLVAAGVIVSAGHTEASYDETLAALDAGLSGITHLFNAMPAMQQRNPGIVGAALDDPRPWCGIIVDGVHVDPAVLRIAIAARGADRMMLVTDAMSSVGATNKDFVLQGRHIRVADGICRFEDGTLAGSDLDMAAAVANSVRDLALTPATASRMASANPAAFLGLAHERGAIAPGLRADLVQLDADFAHVATWIGGTQLA
ncbi:N-acetylglucosamine-6-phosphate deacetylase [Sphingomonas floccifaciens]|uniref:N-acetylglucosamine-6-phosphate deacetylase n=1 Tax=Sphingomonas floccifaciens TaxID=1844115 RepID=A0ABW4NKD4_9SPHN